MEDITHIGVESGVTDSQYVKVSRLHYRQNAASMSWDIAERRDSVAILVYDRDDDCFVMVRQFRPAMYLRSLREVHPELKSDTVAKGEIAHLQDSNKDGLGFTLELCAGLVDKEGKSIAQIAMEEVEEECGYRLPNVEKLEPIANYFLSVASSATRQWLYYAEVDHSMRLHNGRYAGAADENEIVEVVRIPVTESRDMFFQGETTPSMPTTLYALTWWFENKRRSNPIEHDK